ncbi:MAG: hypothetical protein JWN34_2845 [Bryobacterales bacterium]|nr:hypothetical protein [Bryobacterales bacterium]
MKKPVSLTLNDKKYDISLDTNDLIEAEDITGMNVLMGAVNIMLPSLGLLRALVFVALKKAGEKFTLEAVGKMITMGNAVPLRDAIIAAWYGGETEPSKQGPSTAYQINAVGADQKEVAAAIADAHAKAVESIA